LTHRTWKPYTAIQTTGSALICIEAARSPRDLRTELEAVSKYMSPGIVLLWDFSNLSVLKLSGVNLKSFFKVLPFEKLSDLREFRLWVWDYYTQAESWVDEFLVPCIEVIVRLEVLDIRCAHPHELLPAPEKHRLSLQVLRLAQCITFRAPQVTVEDIEKLRTMCRTWMSWRWISKSLKMLK
jgi:hypothetical protein